MHDRSTKSHRFLRKQSATIHIRITLVIFPIIEEMQFDPHRDVCTVDAARGCLQARLSIEQSWCWPWSWQRDEEEIGSWNAIPSFGRFSSLLPFPPPPSLRLFHFHYVHPLPSASIPSFYLSFSTVCFPAFPSLFFLSLSLSRPLPLLPASVVFNPRFVSLIPAFPCDSMLAYAFSVKGINITVSWSSFLLSGLAPGLLRLSSRFRGSHFVYNRVFPFRVTPEQPY